MGCSQLGATFFTENWSYLQTGLKRKPLDFANILHKIFQCKSRMTVKHSIG